MIKKTCKHRKLKNAGSSIVSVIVIMALVMVLVTIATSTSLMNYYMKVNAKNSRNNFYDAEAALEEVRMGLSYEVSGIISEAYMDIMQSYNDYDSEKQKEIFDNKFIVKLGEKLKDPADSTRWSKTALATYFHDTAPTGDLTNYGSYAVGAAITTDTINYFSVTDDGVILKNVKVRYIDADSYSTEIQSDLVIKYPEISFAMVNPLSDLVNYTLVANEDLKVVTHTLDVKGSAYLGKNESSVTGKTIFNKVDALTDADVIFGGDLDLKGQLQATDINLYVGNFNMKAGKLDVNNCVSVVTNDLVLGSNGANGSEAVVSGEYYGTGMADLADESSSIIVNGVNSKLDLSGLTVMQLGGVAYVDGDRSTEIKKTAADTPAEDDEEEAKDKEDAKEDPAKKDENATDPADIMMGESIAIKPSQRAYLVPAEAVGAGYVNGGANPMTQQQYKDLLGEIMSMSYDEMLANDMLLAKANLIDYSSGLSALGDKSLANIGVNAYKICAYPLEGVGTMIYFFMVFDSENEAEIYFNNYEDATVNPANNLRYQSNLGKYLKKGFKLPILNSDNNEEGSLNFYYKGALLVDDTNTVVRGLASTVTEEASDAVTVSLTDKGYEFKGLNKKLIKDYSSLSSEERAKDVYSNLVRDMSKGINKIKNSKIASGKTLSFEASTGEKAYVVNGDTALSKCPDASVIIANGNVVLDKGDFEGLIISAKEISTDCSCNIKANATKVINALSAKNADGLRAGDYLKSSDFIGMDDSDEEDKEAVDIIKLVEYANWTKLTE